VTEEERPTGVICPICSDEAGMPGKGFVVIETSTTHRGGPCALCRGKGTVDKRDYQQWKLRNVPIGAT
jgi:hypothetical protein